MKKYRVFLGSSSEATPLLDAFAHELSKQNVGLGSRESVGDLIEIRRWRFIDVPGESYLDTLLREAADSDFAVFICHPDDTGIIRDRPQWLIRDNVIFEFGIFMSQLGRSRCFALLPERQPQVHAPSDWQGMTFVFYQSPAGGETARELRTNVADAAMTIADVVLRHRRNDRKLVFQRLPVLERMVSRGVEDVYSERIDALEDLRTAIAGATRSVMFMARVYWSELLREPAKLVECLVHAAASHEGEPSDLEVLFAATDPDDVETCTRLWHLEDPEHDRWKTCEQYREEHLRRDRDRLFSKLKTALDRRVAALARTGVKRRKTVRIRIARVRGYVLPSSYALIDEEKLFVGFYKLAQLEPFPYGTFSPTLQLRSLEDTHTDLFEVFREDMAMVARSHLVGLEDLWVIPATD